MTDHGTCRRPIWEFVGAEVPILPILALPWLWLGADEALAGFQVVESDSISVGVASTVCQVTVPPPGAEGTGDLAMFNRSMIRATIPLVLVLILVGNASAGPPFPLVVWGRVYMDGVPAEDGTLVEARIDGVTVTSCRTYTADGEPGHFILAIFCDPGDEVHLFVEGEEANESPWECGGPFGGNLTVGAPAKRLFLPLVLKEQRT